MGRYTYRIFVEYHAFLNTFPKNRCGPSSRMKPRLKDWNWSSLMLILPWRIQLGNLFDGDGLVVWFFAVVLEMNPRRKRPAEKRDERSDVGRRIGVVFLLLPGKKFRILSWEEGMRKPFVNLALSGSLR